MFGLFFLFISALGVLAALLFINQWNLEKSGKQRYDSYVLAQVLRQTSDDLTRFARTYVVTGDPRFENYYWDILAIREGAKPWPEHFERIYWDFVAATGKTPRPAGGNIPLYKLFKNVGITQDEFAKMLEAEANSNALVKTEEIAMNAVKGLYDDGTGEFTRRGEPNRAWAIQILYDEAYHQEKAKIMKPIDDFFVMLDARTLRTTEQYERAGRLYLQLIIGMLVLLFILTLTSFAIISAKVNSSFAAFAEFFQRAATGDNRISTEQVNFREFQEMAAAANQMVEEREKAEEALAESEELYRSVFANVPLGIMYYDKDGIVTDLNENFAQIIGAPKEKIVGFNLPQQLRDQNLRQAILSSLDGQAGYYEGDYCSVTGDKLTPLRVFCQPIVSPRREVLGGVSIFEDYTEKKRAEEALRDSKERLNLTLGATGIGIWERDLRQHTLTWDKATQSILGLSSDELAGHQEIFLERVHPDDLERLRDETRQAIAGTRDYSTEFRVIWPDASMHMVATRAVVLRDDQGSATRMIGACWDITDTKQREQLAFLGSEVGDALTGLKPIQERLQLCAAALVRQLDAALARIWTVDETGELLEMQASAGLHTHTDGLRSRIPLGKYKIGRIAQEARVRFSNQVSAEPDVDDQDWVKQHGLVSFVGHPLMVEGRMVGVMAFFSRTKLHPDTVHALAGIAKTIAVAIDRDRAERELEEAREAAEAATRAKSAFLANMSHELRTPMNAILGYSEMLMEDAEDQGQEDFIPDLQKIHTAGKHLLGLINEILDLSKIEAGKMDLYLETFDVAGMVNDVASTLAPLVEKNANTLQVHSAPDLGTMHADLTKVRQSLFNLLSNASKFTQNGTITLDAASVLRNGVRWIAFRVTDTGIGMTAEQIDKLFQPFVQADASTSRKYGGTGLGMTITQHFTKMMGGEISVASKPGSGTTFTVLLPAEVKAQPPVPLPHPEVAEPQLQPGLNTVLVIEDDPGARDLLTRFLTKEGYRVETAAGGAAGLRLARELHPDVITLDVMMPGQDGWSVLSELKADPELADIPVVMLTIVDDKNLGYALGAADYLTKPIQRDRLLAVLEKYCPPVEPATVMVVEDDVETQVVIRRLLEKAGIGVVVAENGRVALERLAEGQPGLILLDLMMPEMDGFQFVDYVRQHEAWRHIPIVVVTAKDLTPEDRLRLNGSVAEIVKKDSKDQEELLAEVSKMVKMRLKKGPVKTV
ncbi:MAG: response regulator [Thermodesulfobacteriota bacterium]